MNETRIERIQRLAPDMLALLRRWHDHEARCLNTRPCQPPDLCPPCATRTLLARIDGEETKR